MQPRPAFARVSATLWSDDSEIIAGSLNEGLLSRGVFRARRAALYRSLSWPVIDGLPRELEVSSWGGCSSTLETWSGVCRRPVSGSLTSRMRSGPLHRKATSRRRRRAHLGYYTLLASQLVGGRGHVYAFEPSLGIFRRLQANLALNGVTNVSALNVAAGAEALGAARAGRRLRKREPQSEVSTRLTRRPPRWYTGVAVEVRTVESAIPSVELERVRVVKVDVEATRWRRSVVSTASSSRERRSRCSWS